MGLSTCVFSPAIKPLTLVEIVERSLCNNPQTRQAWSFAKIQAAELGQARSVYLPNINADIPLAWNKTHTNGVNSNSRTYDTSLSLDYLLFSFTREPSVETARQSLKAANWTQDQVLQNILFNAVTAYYQLFSSNEAVNANKTTEAYSLENLKAATLRYEVGVATLADKLQAETAYSQAKLTRVRSEGEVFIAQGNLANIMGMEAGTPIDIASPPIQKPDTLAEQQVKTLIDEAKKARPELLAAEADVKAARANVAAVQGTGLPSLSLVGNHDTVFSDSALTQRNDSIGVRVTVPLFTGFNIHYQTEAAKAQLENQIATRDQVKNQVSLQVWQAYYNLITNQEAMKTSNDLLKSATESEKVASGRYKAGVGSILELLNAESSLASARLEQIRAQYNWYIAKVALAQAIGKLQLDSITQ